MALIMVLHWTGKCVKSDNLHPQLAHSVFWELGIGNWELIIYRLRRRFLPFPIPQLISVNRTISYAKLLLDKIPNPNIKNPNYLALRLRQQAIASQSRDRVR